MLHVTDQSAHGKALIVISANPATVVNYNIKWNNSKNFRWRIKTQKGKFVKSPTKTDHCNTSWNNRKNFQWIIQTQKGNLF